MKNNEPERDLDLEILVNSVVAAKSAANAAEAAMRNWLKKRTAGPSGGASGRPVPPTFMARATRMVHHDSPEERDDAGQTARDGGGPEREGRSGSGSQDDTRGDDTTGAHTKGDDIQQG
jgi:hypothetical protein